MNADLFQILSILFSVTSLVLLLFLVIRVLKKQGQTGTEDVLSAVRALEQAVHLELSALNTRFHQFEQSLRAEASTDRGETQKQLQANRVELSQTLQTLSDATLRNAQAFNELQKQKADEMAKQLLLLRNELSASMETIRKTVEERLILLQDGNEKKLEQMRETVDEKLHQALEQRLNESFKQVSERLQQVHEGLGEMKTLAAGVGDLKHVLANVKKRGILGEIQLGGILESILTPQQYDKNVVTKPGSTNYVEYAVKLPGKESGATAVYLPIDSKFPIEAYNRLLDAYDATDPEAIKNSIKELEREVLRCAKDIRDKYIDPPHTTDFGILFLPIEGLYAEVVRRQDLLEALFRDMKVTVVGPTTLAATLNSLQMGFRTLAIEKRSSEVWKVLGAVKTEFRKFGEVLAKAQVKINQANQEIDQLVGARSRKIEQTLRGVQELNGHDAEKLLSDAHEAPVDEKDGEA
jgi:DNA recombination protein RmuC